VIHDACAFGFRQKLRTEADEPSRGNAEFHPNAPAAVIHHLRHRAAPDAYLRDHDALKLLGDIDDQIFDWLHDLTVDFFRDDIGPGDLQLESFAPHHLDQD
jgi:hypothetical protein